MPRITECLAQRQEVAPEEDNSLSEYDYESEYDVVTDDYDTEEADIEGSSPDYYETVDETVEEAVDDYDFDYAVEDNIEVDVPLDLPLDEEALDEPEEDQEEVEVNIDEGFLSDSSGNTVDIPTVESRSNVAVQPSVGGGNTF